MSQDAGFSNNPFLEDASQASVGRSDRLREPRAAKNRQRGLSLRTQLLNRSLMEQEIPSYSHKLSPTREFQTDDIELTAVDGSYASHDSQVFKFEPDYSDIDGPRTSDEEPSLLLGKRPKVSFSLGKFYHKVHDMILGIRRMPPSVGGRDIPLTMSLFDSELPYTIPKKESKPVLLDARNNFPYINNLITSSRYTIYSFVPRQLYAQFSKVANCYFLCVAIMQMIPSWSTTGTYTTIVPLLIFITISILREGYDDFRRHKLDREENNKRTCVLSVGEHNNSLAALNFDFARSTTSMLPHGISEEDDQFDDPVSFGPEDSEEDTENSFKDVRLLEKVGIHPKHVAWKDVKVGDVVKLNADDWVPADVVLLTSSNELGETFVETMALDGETNLKSKTAHSELQKACNTARNLRGVSAEIHSEDPNLDLYNYEGSVSITTKASNKEVYPLGPDNVIYRGSIIRNTDVMLGLVIFTGEETKIRMNAIKNPRTKAPKLQRSINMIVIFMVCVVVLLSGFSLMAERILYGEHRHTSWYLYDQDAGVAATLMGFVIMFNTLIPLSLYVTMEIIKVMQLCLLQWDIDMYHQPSNTPAEARTATILEELGQVSYVFSDKTGTLTDNVMLFRNLSVVGTSWLHGVDQSKAHIEDAETNSKVPTRQGSRISARRPSMGTLDEPRNTPSTQPTLQSTADLIRYVQTNPSTLFSKKVNFFLLSLALCHSCLPKKVCREMPPGSGSSILDTASIPIELGVGPTEKDEDDDDEIEIQYQASSPDELALITAASDLGYVLYDRKNRILSLKTYPDGFDKEPVEVQYEVLDVIDFTSTRKRMSVIVKFPDGRICLLCKGADNIILERLRNKDLAAKKQKELAKQIQDRRHTEANLVLHKKSMDAQSRSSLSSNHRSSLNIGRTSFQVSTRGMNSIDNFMMQDSSETSELDEIAMSSRKSLHLQQAKKYGYEVNSSKNSSEPQIPPDSLILNEEFVLEKTLEHIEEYSTEGLRTLMYSFRWLDKAQFEDWSAKYTEAKTSLVDRSKKIETIGALLECQLELCGATAIEDKLQHGVPEAIEKLRKAGIKLWMLTGDKRETAINIGHSCSLIKDYSTVIILSNEDEENIATKITAATLEVDAGNIAHCVVVVDGSTLSEIESDLTTMTVFVELGVKADSVICCRASPSQKATMVSYVRRYNTSKVTLAIGDGANDIAMIQSADIGVGITGKEGFQAARASDYSIAQFRYLLKLLLVHGRYNYERTSKFVLCTFYKELLFYLSQALYQRQNLFTGSSQYESWSLSMFNTLFTSLPVLCIGMFEKDLRPSTLLAVPELYSKGRNYESFNLRLFVYWVLLGAAQSTALSFLAWNVYGTNATKDNTTMALGVLMFTTLVVVINVKCNVLEMHYVTKIPLISMVVSLGGWMIWNLLISALYKTKDSKIFYVVAGFREEFGRDVTWWGSLLVLIVIGVGIDVIARCIRVEFWPTESETFQILERIPSIRKRLEFRAFGELYHSWTWPHESQIRAESNGPYSRIAKIRSFVKKGGLGPSAATRKRSSTLPTPTELPPGSPSSVTRAADLDYDEEMLPSGKVIRKRQRANTKGRLRRLLSFDDVIPEAEEDSEDDVNRIISDRMRQLERDSSAC